MAADQSYLTHPRYGYDFVVATTQTSINATLKKYLDGLSQAETYICFTYDKANKRNVQVTFDELKKLTNGTDPFLLPANTDTSGSDILNLSKAKFVAGIKITLGLPTNFDDPSVLPPIVELKEGTSGVIYNMLCANIQICELSYTADGPEWLAISQNDTREKAWIFQSKVDMRLDTKEFQALPDNVKKGIKNLDGAMFDVQQLIFDLSNAALQNVPTVSGLDPSSQASSLLTRFFVNSYFGHMKAEGEPVLNYVVRHKPQNATLKPTDLNFHISPLVGQLDPGLITLDYLCATGNHKLPPAVDFTWDWMNGTDASQYHGVISINRNTFAQYLMDELFPFVRGDCFIPMVECRPKGLGVSFNAWAGATPDDTAITHQIPGSGSNILKFSYVKESYDYAGLDGALGHTGLKQDYSKIVTVKGNKVTVVTHMIVFLSIKSLQTKNEANIVDKTITDVYELAVDARGTMTMTKTTDLKDDSKTDSANWLSELFTGANEIFNHFVKRDFRSNDFKSIDITAFRDFVFPGGETFAFKGFRFSNNQDFVAAITYADIPADKK